MGKFKNQKGKIIVDISLAPDMRVTIHEKTSPEILSMFKNAVEAVEKARKKDDGVSN